MPKTDYRSLIDNAPDPILVCDAQWQVVYVNTCAAERYGWTVEGVIGRSFDALCTEPSEAAELRVAVERRDQGDQILSLRHDDGAVSSVIMRGVSISTGKATSGYALYLSRPSDDSTSLRLAGQVRSLKASLQAYREVALTDPLSGLPNRRALEDALSRECARAAREGTAVSAIMLDLDGFKQINDQHGHAAGDEALRRYAQLLRRLCRRYDFLGRWGGDEFLIILPVWAPQAWRCAERLRAAVAQEVIQPGWKRCTLSAGLASAERPSADSGPTLVAQADAVLYTAKRAGGNCIRIAPLQGTTERTRRAG